MFVCVISYTHDAHTLPASLLLMFNTTRAHSRTPNRIFLSNRTRNLRTPKHERDRLCCSTQRPRSPDPKHEGRQRNGRTHGRAQPVYNFIYTGGGRGTNRWVTPAVAPREPSTYAEASMVPCVFQERGVQKCMQEECRLCVGRPLMKDVEVDAQPILPRERRGALDASASCCATDC